MNLYISIGKFDLCENFLQKAFSSPVWLNVVVSSEEFNFPGAWRKPLNDAINFVGFVRGGPHLRHNNIAVHAPVDLGLALHAHLNNSTHINNILNM